MGLFDFLHAPDVNEGVKEFAATQDAVLLDVRTQEEYAQGHIPKSISIPLQDIQSISLAKDTPLFVYCHSGARSAQAAAYLKKAGYSNVRNIGGIAAYHGKVER